MNSEKRRMGLAVLAAALGYFVDAYDLILYNIVRVQSLQGIGVPDVALLRTGVDLLNAQLVGMLVGGVLWGVLGDRRGRRSVLFGSILVALVISNGLQRRITRPIGWNGPCGNSLTSSNGFAGASRWPTWWINGWGIEGCCRCRATC